MALGPLSLAQGDPPGIDNTQTDELSLGPDAFGLGNGAGTAGGRPVTFSAGAGFNFMTGNGFANGFAADRALSLWDRSAYGVFWSVFGTKQFATSTLGVSYFGHWNFSPRRGGHGFTSQFLSVSYVKTLSYRASVAVNVVAGTTNGMMGGVLSRESGKPLRSPAPLLDPLPGRVHFGGASVSGGYRLTQRLSLIGTGSSFITSRHTAGLASSVGYVTQGGVSYALTPLSSLSGTYVNSQFFFSKGYGGVHAQSAQAGYTRRLSETVTVAFAGGLGWIRSRRLETTAVDPIVAELLGSPTVTLEGDRRFRFFVGSVSLAKQYQFSNLQLFADRGFNPGNGLFGGAVADSAGVNYDYFGLGRLSINALANWTRLNSASTLRAQFESAGGGVGLAYPLGRHVSVSSRYDRRRILGERFFGRRDFWFATVGIGFNTNEYPLRFW